MGVAFPTNAKQFSKELGISEEKAEELLKKRKEKDEEDNEEGK